MPIGPPALGRRPATATSPPMLTSTPRTELRRRCGRRPGQPRNALADEPRSRRTPRGIRTVRRRGQRCTCPKPTTRPERRRRSGRAIADLRRSRGRSRERRWRCPRWGRRRRPSVRAAIAGTSSASKRRAQTATVRPDWSWSDSISESDRNRLQARSMASSSASSSHAASSASAGSCTTTVAVVPMARNERTVSAVSLVAVAGVTTWLPTSHGPARSSGSAPWSWWSSSSPALWSSSSRHRCRSCRPAPVVVVVVGEAVVEVVLATPLEVPALPALAPGWSRDTTTPMATVAPVAATTVPRVRVRNQARARSRSAGVCDRSGAGMPVMSFCWRHPKPNTLASYLTQDGLWGCCDFAAPPSSLAGAGRSHKPPLEPHGSIRSSYRRMRMRSGAWNEGMTPHPL